MDYWSGPADPGWTDDAQRNGQPVAFVNSRRDVWAQGLCPRCSNDVNYYSPGTAPAVGPEQQGTSMRVLVLCNAVADFARRPPGGRGCGASFHIDASVIA